MRIINGWTTVLLNHIAADNSKPISCQKPLLVSCIQAAYSPSVVMNMVVTENHSTVREAKVEARVAVMMDIAPRYDAVRPTADVNAFKVIKYLTIGDPAVASVVNLYPC